jgi:hypothetical protein
MFTGSALDAQTIHDSINHPRNALNLESNTHDSMDKHLAWGIEAISSGDDDQVSFVCFGCDLEFTHHLVQVLLSSCSTGYGDTLHTAAGR